MKLKWPELPVPSLETIRIANIGTAAFCGLMIYFAGSSWTGVIDAFIAGTMVMSALHIGQSIRMRDNFNKMHGAFKEMMEINHALIEGRVEMVITGEIEPSPRKPILH
jgi:hypothetical protein